MKLEKLTEKIIGCAYKVHNKLGFGFLESVYEKSLLIELNKEGLNVQTQKPIEVFYEEKLVGEFVADIIVEESVIIEVKAIKQLAEEHDFKICLTYHTSGELILYPWGYTKLPAKDKQLFESIGEDIKKINKYRLSQSVYLYPTLGDACDWLYGRKGVIPYTVELGTSQAPGDPEVLREMCIIHIGVNLYVCEKAELI